MNRVTSLFHLFAYVHSFDQTLLEYKDLLAADGETKSLDVKGNGWLASFPYPNQTVTKGSQRDEIAAESIPDEELEKAADLEPANYEFLGPGIDSGFRISRNSTTSFFTLSPALAHALCRANTNRDYEKFSFDLKYGGVNHLKGVIREEAYPIVGITTERDKDRSELLRRQAELDGTPQLEAGKLIDYLENFMKFHEVEMPEFTPNGPNGGVEVPSFYTDLFLPEWHRQKNEIDAANKNLEESREEKASDQDSESDILNDLSTLFEVILKQIQDKNSPDVEEGG